MKSPNTLVDLLMEQAQRHHDHPAYIFLDENGTEQVLVYGELDRKARCIAARLTDKAASGSRAVLMFPSGLDYISAFFGCLYAGIIAVPTYPINPARPNHASSRLLEIIADCTPDLILTNTQLHSALQNRGGKRLTVGDATWLDTTSLDSGESAWRPANLHSDSLAFLQYTSGSTSAPKGVMVSHGNLLHNEWAIRIACRHTEDSTFVGWLPLFHDMGLIGNILQPLYLGSTSVLMSPMTFLQSPLRWLQAISKYQACTSGGPNFGYELCIRKVSREETEGLNLSTWRVAFNGAEPVRPSTLDRFAQSFKHCGFRRDSFFPCYGLAEATLMVSGGPPATTIVHRLDRDAFAMNRIVLTNHSEAQVTLGCGSTMADQKLSIVDSATLAEAGPDAVGEIWVKGPSVASGYWNRVEQTRETFKAHIAGSGEGPFLRTGDLGFVRDGQLFIAGRKKDLIIIRGRNYYPQDIERTSEDSAQAFRKGCSAAFSIEKGGEEVLVVLQEVERHPTLPLETLTNSLRSKVVSDHGVQPYAVALLAPGGVLKTTSGKVQRSACRTAFIKSDLPVLYCNELKDRISTVSTERLTQEMYLSLQPEFRIGCIESYLISQAADILKRSIGPSELRRSAVTLGADSLNAAELASRIESDLSVRVGVVEILENCSLANLAAQISRQLERIVTIVPTGPSETAQIAQEVPLSYGQQAFWIMDQIKADIGESNLSNAVRLGEDTNLELLRQAFEVIRERHESLRVAYIRGKHELVQKYLDGKDVPMDFTIQDASSWTDVKFQQVLAEEAQRPFNLSAGQPFRGRVFRGHGPQPVLLMVFHHSIVDFWSIGILVSELANSYSSLKSRADVSLPRLNARYVDFVRWQAEFLASAAGEQAWNYWQEQLRGPLPVLRLPKAAGAESCANEIGSVPICLPSEYLNLIKQAAKSESLTLNSYLLAAFAALLHRHTAQDEIMIGTPATGRGAHPQFRDVVGYFVNSLPLRIHLSGDPQFRQLAGNVQSVLFGAMRNQDFPFSLIVERLKPPRRSGRTPIFQALFVWQQTHLPGLEGLTTLTFGQRGAKWTGGDLSLEAYPFGWEPARFDLTLFVNESSAGLQATFRYNSETFDSTFMKNMASRFISLLTEISTNPERPISEFALMNSEEQTALVKRFNSGMPSGRVASFVELFEAHATADPNRPALVDDQTQLTYGELSRRVNNLAAYLLRFGARPEQRIAVFLPRSANAIVVVLGILRAGAAYVPLHVSDPKARLAQIIKDAGASLVITESSIVDQLPEDVEDLVLIDMEPELMGSQSAAQDMNVDLSPGNLAYIIYTSGSTGKPKGVMVQHDSVLNLLNGLNVDIYSQFGGRTLRVGLNAPLSFDGSVKQLVCLALGHTLYVLPETARRDPTALAGYIERNQLEVLDCTPSQAETLYVSGVASAADATTLLLGGEPIPEPLWRRLAGKSQACFNMYGPTECTVDATAYRILPDTSPSLGQPLSTARVYILDRHLRAVPPGVAGQICIGGISVARGYDGRADLTSERFVPDPFASEKGSRMYLSGDSARYSPDGKIEYLGRIDRQVKVRGFRIEPGEIESVLRSCPGVRDAAVVLREVGESGNCLVAYVVTTGEAIDIGQVNKYTHMKLPDYMVPTVVNVITAMPMTANGKRDLNALPDPVATASSAGPVTAPPRSPIEQTLTLMWQKALNVKKIGIHDDFFALGGHSLLATKLVSALQEVFQADVPLLTLFFQDPTIAGLGKALARTRLGQTHLDEAARALQKFELMREPEDAQPVALAAAQE